MKQLPPFFALFLLALNSAEIACGQDGGDTFATATTLSPGTLSVIDSLTARIAAPNGVDTFMRAAIPSGGFWTNDDSPISLGNGFASALEDVPIGPDGTISIDVTGYDDQNTFTGVQSLSNQGPFIADFFIENELTSNTPDFSIVMNLFLGEVAMFDLTEPAYANGSYTVRLDNFAPSADGDLDYYRFTGLTPGEAFDAETFAVEGSPIDPATRLTLFDDGGQVIDVSDSGAFSSLSGVVPASGELLFAVSGFDDTALTGRHREQGEYELSITLPNSPIPGDFDGDGEFDQEDYLAWDAAYGSSGASLPTDGNRDGVVNAADYTLWRDAFDSQTPSAVPEPVGLAMAGLAVAPVSLRRKRSR